MIEQELTRREDRNNIIAKNVWLVTEDGPKMVVISELEFPVLLIEGT